MNESRSAYFKKHIALPGEHGAWVFILSPLLIGIFAGGIWNTATLLLVIAAMSGFLFRQPVVIAVKAYSGRRTKKDLPAAYLWMGIYGITALAALSGLVILGFGELLLLALPGLPVFAWHLWLISRRAERRQPGIEIIGSGVLALAAPAALWIARGWPDPAGIWLFVLCWLQSAASIVYAYLRLQQRELPAIPGLAARIRMAARTWIYTTFNLLLVGGLSLAGVLPAWLTAPFALQWIESIYGALIPAVGYKPTRIGFRQLAVSTLFTILFILTWQEIPR